MSFDDDTSMNQYGDIEDLLDEVPKDMRSGLQKITIHIEGENTIIGNYQQIISQMNRDPNQVAKFISTKLGAKTKLKDKQIVIQKRLTQDQVNNVFDSYVNKYVICKNCGKPDTVMEEASKKKSRIRCLACGHEISIKN